MISHSRLFDYIQRVLLLIGSSAEKSHNPAHATPTGYHTQAVWPVPRSLATTNGITELFSLPVGTEMFHFPTFPLQPYEFRLE